MSDGIGVMINRLCGENGGAVFAAAVGKRIASVKLEDNEIRIRLVDGTGIKLLDKGQSCCETRWITCDDDLAYFSGAELRGAEVVDGGDRELEYGDVSETAFLKVSTSLGTFTATTHNEHNGYYGGFWVCCEEMP